MTNRTDMTEAQTDKLYDHHRQQLSAMLDGELPPDQAKFMLRRLEHDGELAACWERWQVCGDILRGRHDALLPADFSQRVANAIAGEGQVETASTAATATIATKPPRWARWGGGAALAASVAIVALFVGRQSPELEPESTSAPVQVVADATSTSAPLIAVPSTPAPTAPDKATTTLATAVAVAALPRRAVERRSRGQNQRAAVRIRQQAESPMMVAVNAAPMTASPTRASSVLADTTTPATIVADPFATQPLPARPWPRAILPNFPAEGAFTASYGSVDGSGAEHPFHPFEPRVELQPASVDDRSGSGPR